MADIGDIMGLKKTGFNVSTRVFDDLCALSLESPELTVSDIIRAGVLAEVERLERENGGPFQSAGKLKKGRRPGESTAEPTRSVSVYMDEGDIERLRNVVYWTRQRLTAFVSSASEKYARDVLRNM